MTEQEMHGWESPEDGAQITFSSASRQGRWHDLRTYLKQLIRALDENSDRLAQLQSEIDEIKEANGRTAELAQGLCDAANEEIQREASLKLNDDDSGLVIDMPPEDVSEPSLSHEDEPSLSMEDFCEDLMKLPRVGKLISQAIQQYIEGAQPESILNFAYALRAVHDDIEGNSNQPLQMPLEGL